MSDGPDADADYGRPPGVDGSFAPRVEPPRYTAPPQTVPPAERAVFGRPPGAQSFAPAPGERIPPRPAEHAPVPEVFAQAFGAPADAQDGFAPAPGSRIGPSGQPPDSPWWKSDAARDPWRDPRSPYWLGRGAVFTGGRPEQLDPDQDAEADELAVGAGTGEQVGAPDNVRRLRFGRSALSVIAVVALIAGLLGGGAGWWLTKHVHDSLHRPDVSIAQVQTPVKRPAGSVAGVARRVGPTVVSIAIQTPTVFAIGSGFVIDGDGDILTNNHVVAPAAESSDATIVVTFSNEATAKAQIVGRDPTSDLAVIKVPNDQLTVAQLGDSTGVAVGDPVIAIGSPLGLQGTVTAGIISALDRPVRVTADDGTTAYINAIQTDAPINHGNSGGPLVNSSGAVVGINSAAAVDPTVDNGNATANGIGYAIPINYARDIALQLIHTGTAAHASFGATGSTVLAGLQVGGYVKQVSPGGPAAKAGLKPGDVIVVADGKVVQTFDQLTVIVEQHKPGDRISVTYYPKDSATKVTTTVTLG
ncbi:MAG TPA: trypsin-like peptidase domain-containing protein [Jatrophihabitans sp.]|nr:trypsin-like peptidase domain-containing protein [Jatrophihabitans sp.]